MIASTLLIASIAFFFWWFERSATSPMDRTPTRVMSWWNHLAMAFRGVRRISRLHAERTEHTHLETRSLQ